MSDRYDENLILGYVEGDLSAGERSAFEQTLGADAKLRALVADLERQRRALRESPDIPAPPQIMETIRQRLERDMLLEPLPEEVTGPARRLMLTRWAVAGAIAAVVLISAAVVLSVLLRGPGGPPATNPLTARVKMDTHSTAPAAAKEVEPNNDAVVSMTFTAPDLDGGVSGLLAYCAQNHIAVERLPHATTQADAPPRLEFTLPVRREQVPMIAAHFRTLWGAAAVESPVEATTQPTTMASGNDDDHRAMQLRVVIVQAAAAQTQPQGK
jgi:hypothetical protein